MSQVTQRDAFFSRLFDFAKLDKDVILLTADCGAPALDRWKEELPLQFLNVGIAEQNMIAVASGLARMGKKPYCYAIAPFATLRSYEFLRVDVSLMNLPVVIVGVGAGLSYNDSGPTHHATEDITVMRSLPNMTIYNCTDSVMANILSGISYHQQKPMYIRLDRQPLPNIYETVLDLNHGMTSHAKGRPDLVVIATGVTVHWALGYDANVIDLFRLKPLNSSKLKNLLNVAQYIITCEEHQLDGGLGSIIAEFLADNKLQIPLRRIGINNGYFYKYGNREVIWDGKTQLFRAIEEYHRGKTSSGTPSRPDIGGTTGSPG